MKATFLAVALSALAHHIPVMADAGVRALDAYSTHRMLREGNHEYFLPSFVVHHQPAMYSYSLGMVGVETLLVRHHRKLKKWVPMIDMSVTAPWVIHDMQLGAHQSKGNYILDSLER